jgi:citrate synthase
MSDRSRANDVVAVESRISAIVDDTLTYRGIPIETLFAQSSFEETVFLLWFGQLPSQPDLTAFRRRIAEAPPAGLAVQELVRLSFPGGVTRALEAGVLGLGLHAPPGDDALALPLLLLTALPDIVAGFDRFRHELPLQPAAMGSSIAERFLAAWRGRSPLPEETRAFDRGLVLIADHELNAATFAARVAASTGADLVSAVLAAIATQSGPLHGGALEEVGALLRDTLTEDPIAEVDRRLGMGQKIPGFGHSVYRGGDPRAALFRQLAIETAEPDGNRRWLDAADRLAQVASQRIGVPPNLDLYAAAYWSALGIPVDLFPAIFAIGRVAGWIAHIREQVADNRLIRPRARYIGRTAEPYLPLEQRGEWFTRRET